MVMLIQPVNNDIHKTPIGARGAGVWTIFKLPDSFSRAFWVKDRNARLGYGLIQ